MAVAIGVDVGIRKGLDVVVLEDRTIAAAYAGVAPADIVDLIDRHRPDTIAIDSPPRFGTTGSSRAAERALAAMGISAYATPSQGTDRPFYDWMRVGHLVFAAAEACGFPLYVKGPSVSGHAFEVFPHASSVVLAGTLPASGTSKSQANKKAWRADVLSASGVNPSTLRSLDAIDAALAALTGVMALEGTFCAAGDPDEGVIVLPCASLPSTRFPRESSGLISPPSVSWADEFDAVAARLRAAFHDVALRIDHIGSTSVDGLGAKDVIDVQVTVASLDDPRIDACMDASGFVFRPEIVSDKAPAWDSAPSSDWRKRYAREREGRRVHVHVREAGKPNQRYALLFRDYLRANPAAAKAYEDAKVVLAELARNRATYVEAKDRFLFDLVFLGAEQWATATGWAPTV